MEHRLCPLARRRTAANSRSGFLTNAWIVVTTGQNQPAGRSDCATRPVPAARMLECPLIRWLR